MIPCVMETWLVQSCLYLYAVTADGLVTGSGEEATWSFRDRRHQQTVHFVCVTHKERFALLGLDAQREFVVLHCRRNN